MNTLKTDNKETDRIIEHKKKFSKKDEEDKAREEEQQEIEVNSLPKLYDQIFAKSWELE